MDGKPHACESRQRMFVWSISSSLFPCLRCGCLHGPRLQSSVRVLPDCKTWPQGQKGRKSHAPEGASSRRLARARCTAPAWHTQINSMAHTRINSTGAVYRSCMAHTDTPEVGRGLIACALGQHPEDIWAAPTCTLAKVWGPVMRVHVGTNDRAPNFSQAHVV